MRIDYYDNRMHNNPDESELFLSCNRQSQLVEHDYVLVFFFFFNIPFSLSLARSLVFLTIRTFIHCSTSQSRQST